MSTDTDIETPPDHHLVTGSDKRNHIEMLGAGRFLCWPDDWPAVWVDWQAADSAYRMLPDFVPNPGDPVKPNAPTLRNPDKPAKGPPTPRVPPQPSPVRDEGRPECRKCSTAYEGLVAAE